jgi:ATP-dependent exoDNAse (exonuclease V) alpha subunit
VDSLLPELLGSLNKALNEGQQKALRHLLGQQNVFLTGGAGTGKSFLLRCFLKGIDRDKYPVLASTGAAAVLIGGRTFHSFFGLGIMEGGPDQSIERALKDRRVVRRLKKAAGFVIDEVSMLSGLVIQTAERIASMARNDPRPWGGLRVIAVGDFAQLPPVTLHPRHRDWAFLNPTWDRSEFISIELDEVMRAKGDSYFCEILSDVRQGLVSERVRDFLNLRSQLPDEEEFQGSVLYARKMDVDRINTLKLHRLKGLSRFYETEYHGDERFVRTLQKSAPIAQSLELREGALVMLRQNDPQGRWVNGSLAHVQDLGANTIEVKLFSGRTVDVEKTSFSLLDAEGNIVASAKNFPLCLAYAVTIHKAQGATLDKTLVSLKGLWEPGQAYVAMSRVQDASGLMIDGWDEESIFADPLVKRFHDRLRDSKSSIGYN